MPKKCPDKQQNEEEPPLSLGRDMPQPAPVDDEELSLGRDMPQPAPADDEAFARRAGEIIGNSNTSLHKAGDKGAKMTTFRTRFTFRVDTWTPDGKSIVEHVAGVETIRLHSPPSAQPANAGPARLSPCGRVRE
jgi:hypothetical protein